MQKDLFKRINKCKQEVKNLRTKLNQIDQHKEHWFEQKDSLWKQSSKLIRQVRVEKKKRDKLTKSVKELKKQRDTLNKTTTKHISEVNVLRKEKDELMKKLKIKSDPEKLRQDIEKAEMRIETEAMPFEKEKKLTKKIKQMIKEFKETAGITQVSGRVATLSKDIDDSKKQANKIHQDIQLQAAKSQEYHEAIIKLSKQIDELKKKEEPAFEKFNMFKQEFSKTSDLLNQKLMELSKFNEQLGEIKKDTKKKKKEREEQFIKEKEEEITKKMKRGKKIKTEDLLVFQKGNMEEK